MNLETRILLRDFSEQVDFPDLRFEPNSYSWRALGGPERASITAYGNELALGDLLNHLRAPIEILDEHAEAVWWGYIDEIALRVGMIEVGVALATMANKVAVAYSSIAPGTQTPGTRATTTWAQDGDSVAAYGTKELLASLSGATAAQADAARDAILNAKKYPIPTIRHSPGQSGLSATLICRGWWDTLAWRYYANTQTDSTETTTQIADIVAGVGQFFTGTSIVDASGIFSSEYRDGDNLALKLIEELLQAGTTSGRRLLATVTRDRDLKVYIEPERWTGEGDLPDLFLHPDRNATDRWGGEILSHTCPVAVWATVKEVLPLGLNLARLADTSWIFIERAEFNAANQQLTLETRDVPSPWDIARVAIG